MNSTTTPQIQVATIRPGDHVRLVGGPTCWLEVIDANDPARLTLAAPNGVQLKCGRQTVAEISRRPS